MFYTRRVQRPITRTYEFLALLFHTTVRNLRGGGNNAIKGLIMSIVSTLALVAIFALVFIVLGLRDSAIRGNFLVFILTGIFMFLTFIKAFAKGKTGGSRNGMILHAPLSSVVIFLGTALAELYNLFLAMVVVLFVTHVFYEPLNILDMVGFGYMFGLCVINGLAFGYFFAGISPFVPFIAGLLDMAVRRGAMILSGKFFVANALPTNILPYFDWFPLFNIVDQARGYAFINYVPRYTSWEYALKFTFWLFVIGIMFDHWVRKYK